MNCTMLTVLYIVNECKSYRISLKNFVRVRRSVDQVRLYLVSWSACGPYQKETVPFVAAQISYWVKIQEVCTDFLLPPLSNWPLMLSLIYRGLLNEDWDPLPWRQEASSLRWNLESPPQWPLAWTASRSWEQEYWWHLKWLLLDWLLICWRSCWLEVKGSSQAATACLTLSLDL